MTDCLNQQGVNAILMRLPGKTRLQFFNWLNGMSDLIDEQSKKKAYKKAKHINSEELIRLIKLKRTN